MRYQGKITIWKDEKGFGFVTMNATGEKAFVHIKSFCNRSKRPLEGDKITYELIADEKNRLCAQNIRFVGEQIKPINSAKPSSAGTVFVALFFLFLVLAIFMRWLSLAVFGYYIAISIVAYFAYYIDKTAAQNNRWRTRESTLHLLGLIGGWPGAFLAQKTLRHKSKKKEFQLTFWATAVFNSSLIVWLSTKYGSNFIESMIGP